MRKHLAITLLVLLSFGFAEDACKKQTGIMTTSFHVFNALFENALTGNEVSLAKYVNKTVYLTPVIYDTIIVGKDYSSLGSYEDRNNQRFVILFSFNNTPEIVKIFRTAVEKGQKPAFQVKGDCVWYRSDPRGVYFLNCCLVDEKQDMIETLNAGLVPAESILDLPGGPWE